MFTKINEEIFELKEQLRVKEKLESLSNMVNEELKKKRAQEVLLEDMLLEENKDVERLEGASISSIFLSLIGKKEEKLDKEREEYIVAKLKYKECLEAIKKLVKELEYAKKELINYIGVKEEYDKLIKDKQNLLIKEGSVRGKELKDNLNILNDLKLDIKEIEEALAAGEKAKAALGDMKSHLQKAKGWGTWDMMGGGLISNLAKHAAIDEANNIAHSSQYLLKSFEKELSDVNEFTDVEVNLTTFSTFADFFLDGFFVDWFVQSKINNSLYNAENAYNKIENIIIDLRSNLSVLQLKQKESEEKVKAIVEL